MGLFQAENNIFNTINKQEMNAQNELFNRGLCTPCALYLEMKSLNSEAGDSLWIRRETYSPFSSILLY